MAILANRVKVKNSLVELSKFILFSIRKFFIVILITASCYLLYFSAPKQLAHGLLEATGRTLSIGSLIYKESISTAQSIYRRLSYFKDLEAENLKLRLEIAALEETKQNILVTQSENRELRQLLNVTPEIALNSITAKVVGMSISPFANSAILQAGSKDGVKLNDIVRGKFGLIGRISEVSSNYSTVMLIHDHNSRIPVITSNSRARGILAKQDDNFKILHLKENHNITVGEIVYTSGDGKIYPKGLAVAKIKKVTSKGVFVEISEKYEKMEFVVIESKTE